MRTKRSISWFAILLSSLLSLLLFLVIYLTCILFISQDYDNYYNNRITAVILRVAVIRLEIHDHVQVSTSSLSPYTSLSALSCPLGRQMDSMISFPSQSFIIDNFNSSLHPTTSLYLLLHCIRTGI